MVNDKVNRGNLMLVKRTGFQAIAISGHICYWKAVS